MFLHAQTRHGALPEFQSSFRCRYSR
jgi:hypothetical protein